MKLLIPTAGPVPAKEKAEYVSKLACSLDAELLVLHIVKNNDETPGLKAFKIFKNQCNKDNIKLKTLIEHGEIVPTISKVADSENVDLIVMGASAGKIVSEWLATDIMKRSKVPIVIIPMGFENLFDQ